MGEALHHVEVLALAKAFPPGPPARALLLEAGFPPESMPSAFGILASDFWSMVAESVAVGQVPDGRCRLMTAAAERLPGNETFVGAAADCRGTVGGGVLRVLVVGAQPYGHQRLRGDRELRAVLRAAELGHLEVDSRPAAAVTDLRRLLDRPADILHLACHGDGGDLLFEEATGEEQRVPASELARTLTAYRDHGRVRLRGLVLGSCHGDQAITPLRDLASEGVAHTGVLDDDCAVAFAGHLYRELRHASGLVSAAVLAARHTVLEDDLCRSLEEGLVVWPAPARGV
ncbi:MULTISPECIES: CHAT domain-containing protein [unclassified Streptomyces]|uniref:CHAT domain-containing protein n=1 Tax=unclassified Streptomyces TaxID=2593676 RepID=UPI002DD99FF1|nr:CHAT domain-containing protein [Streptomyces sp. NBC_00243]WRZ18951.1 CHAT domain-containing protein [Streptomyces sp. NBC_00243]